MAPGQRWRGLWARGGVAGAGIVTASLVAGLAAVGAVGVPLSFVSGVAARVTGEAVRQKQVSLQVVSDAATSQYATTTLTTKLSAGSIRVGGSAYDTATLSGQTSTASGTVTYTVYSNSGCSAGAQSAGTVTVTNGKVPNSDTLKFSSAGTYYWQAVYSGDAANSGSSSACTSERLTVAKAEVSLTTKLSKTSPVAIGTSVTDQATLSGETGNAGGRIYYAVFRNSDTILVANLTPSNNTVVNGVAPPSIAWTARAAGTYYFLAIYGGDANNLPSISPLTSEQLAVSTNSSA